MLPERDWGSRIVAFSGSGFERRDRVVQNAAGRRAKRGSVEFAAGEQAEIGNGGGFERRDSGPAIS